MKLFYVFSFFLLAGIISASPLPQQDGGDPQFFWIIEAIAEGDFTKALEIIGEHINHLIATGKNITDVTRFYILAILEQIHKLPLEGEKKEIVERWIAAIQEKLGALEKSYEETKAKFGDKSPQQLSLIEDIKEVINQIKNQVGSIINTGGNIKDIIDGILG